MGEDWRAEIRLCEEKEQSFFLQSLRRKGRKEST